MKLHLIPASMFSQADWTASAFCRVGPRPVVAGLYAGSYVVNPDILKSDPAFARYAPLLDKCSIVDLNSDDLLADDFMVRVPPVDADPRLPANLLAPK